MIPSTRIMPPRPIWMHCNLCFERQTKSWHISSCGKIVCQNCVQKLKMTHCEDCKGPCTRTIELNSKAPKEVQRLFGDITYEIKAVSKIMNFTGWNKPIYGNLTLIYLVKNEFDPTCSKMPRFKTGVF